MPPSKLVRAGLLEHLRERRARRRPRQQARPLTTWPWIFVRRPMSERGKRAKSVLGDRQPEHAVAEEGQPPPGARSAARSRSCGSAPGAASVGLELGDQGEQLLDRLAAARILLRARRPRRRSARGQPRVRRSRRRRRRSGSAPPPPRSSARHRCPRAPSRARRDRASRRRGPRGSGSRRRSRSAVELELGREVIADLGEDLVAALCGCRFAHRAMVYHDSRDPRDSLSRAPRIAASPAPERSSSSPCARPRARRPRAPRA